MAGSRLEKFGTVFTRVRDLLRSGVIKPSEKPIWYDVYAAFPPKRDPLHIKPHTRQVKRKDTVPEIFYREDKIRAKFYARYELGHRSLELFNSNYVSLCQRFVEKYMELESNSELSDSALFEETGKALLLEGIVLRSKGPPPVSSGDTNPGLEPMQADLLAEQQSISADSEETTDDTHRPEQL